MTEHRVGVNGVVQIDPNEVLGIERDEGVVTGASVLLWPGRWRIALRESSGGGGGSGPVTWADVINKPLTFAPSAHRHDASEIDNLPSGSGGPVAWTDVTDKPTVIAAGVDAAAARTAIGAGTSSLVIGTGAGDAKAGNYTPPDATGAVKGLVQLAGDLTGTAASPALANTAVTPGSYTLSSITVDSKGRITAASSGAAGSVADATTTSKGVVQLAGDLTGTAAAPTVVAASETVAGKVELATTAEATAGTDTQRAVTPAAARAAGDARYVRTVNGTGPDSNGDVAVSGGASQPISRQFAFPPNYVIEWPGFGALIGGNESRNMQTGTAFIDGPYILHAGQRLDRLAGKVSTAPGSMILTIFAAGAGDNLRPGSVVWQSAAFTPATGHITVQVGIDLAPGAYFVATQCQTTGTFEVVYAVPNHVTAASMEVGWRHVVGSREDRAFGPYADPPVSARPNVVDTRSTAGAFNLTWGFVR